MYRTLNPDHIIQTIGRLHDRIQERFPGSGLSKVAAELQQISVEAVARAEWISKPLLALRIGIGALVALLAAIVLVALANLNITKLWESFADFVQAVEAGINDIVFIGIAIFFLVTLEARIKRKRALKAIHELRALAHIIDMHQLTKDPESYFAPQQTTTVKRAMTSFELNRYLDYCSEALALISKIAALYVQGFEDPVLLAAGDDMEDLTAGFSRKIWQKLTILETLGRTLAEGNR